MRPIDLSGLWIEAVYCFAVPDDELPFAARFVNGRRTITEILGREGSPNLLAAVLIKRNGGAVVPTDHADKLLAVDQRMAGVTPDRRFCFVFLDKVMRP